ncbi:uncharacterized protein LOC143496659 [Brachyhypopomus gauderio]|uniref:uncharacterized protein LOC143496659 n=1 Tax=Brachyhypopomus gauderio TaxID=698409 RepID=UPI004041CE78
MEQMKIKADHVVKTENDEDPIWACYLSSQNEWDPDASGIKSEHCWIKTEPAACQMGNAVASRDATGVSTWNVPSDLTGGAAPQPQSVRVVKQSVVKDEDPIWAHYHSIKDKEWDTSASGIKSGPCWIKTEPAACQMGNAVASRDATGVYNWNVPSDLTGGAAPQPQSVTVVKQSVVKDEDPIWAHYHSNKNKENQSRLREIKPQHLNIKEEPCTSATVTESVAACNTPDVHYLLPPPHSSFHTLLSAIVIMTPNKSGQTSTLGQGHLISSSRSLTTSQHENFYLSCQLCQRVLKSHYEEGCQHKLPKGASYRQRTLTRNWKCCRCSVAFSTHGRLCLHISRHVKIQCKDCGLTFNTRKKLEYHKRSHEPPTSCTECGKMFKSKFHLWNHKKIHTEDSIKHFCELCGKGFRFKANLKIHMTVHTSERPFECPDCKARFKALAYMTKHRLTHTDIKPFPCPVCEVTFRAKASMKSHLKTHTNDTMRKRQMMRRGKRKRKVQLSESEEEDEEWQEEESEDEENAWQEEYDEEEDGRQEEDDEEASEEEEEGKQEEDDEEESGEEEEGRQEEDDEEE